MWENSQFQCVHVRRANLDPLSYVLFSDTSTENQTNDDEDFDFPSIKALKKRRNALIPRILFDNPDQHQTERNPKMGSFPRRQPSVSAYPNRVETVNSFYVQNRPAVPRRDVVLADMIAEENRYRLINVSPTIHNARHFKPLKDISTCSMPLVKNK